MAVEVYGTQREADGYLADELVGLLCEKPGALICIAAGHSSLGLFDALAEANTAGRVSFSKARFVAMDEWAGMDASTPGSCGDFLVRNFLSRVDLPASNVRLFHGRAVDLGAECEDVEHFIDEAGGIDFLVLGMGMNGHIALNEPGSAFDSRARAVSIDDITRRVGQKYFEAPTALVGGVTLGIANLCAARRIMVTIYGTHKAEAASAAIEGEISETMPASAPRRVGAQYVLDKAAAVLLGRRLVN